jgi:hypothetical protein
MVSKPRARRWRPTKNQRQSNMLQFNNLDRAGVAELADAQDLGFFPAIFLNLFVFN